MYGSGQWTVFDGYAAHQMAASAGMGSNNLDPNARSVHGKRGHGIRYTVPE